MRQREREHYGKGGEPGKKVQEGRVKLVWEAGGSDSPVPPPHTHTHTHTHTPPGYGG